MMECKECEDGYQDSICGNCSGSGEGMADGTTCRECKGRGEFRVECEECEGSGEMLSPCCGAEIVLEDVCLECKEHCI